MNKKATVEVLVKSFSINDSGLTLYPIDCPGKGVVSDMQVDEESSPCCIYQDKKCNYFTSVQFDVQRFDKTLVCEAIDNAY